MLARRCLALVGLAATAAQPVSDGPNGGMEEWQGPGVSCGSRLMADCSQCFGEGDDQCSGDCAVSRSRCVPIVPERAAEPSLIGASEPFQTSKHALDVLHPSDSSAAALTLMLASGVVRTATASEAASDDHSPAELHCRRPVASLTAGTSDGTACVPSHWPSSAFSASSVAQLRCSCTAAGTSPGSAWLEWPLPPATERATSPIRPVQNASWLPFLGRRLGSAEALKELARLHGEPVGAHPAEAASGHKRRGQRKGRAHAR
jgi:hypothetical protein